MIERIFIAGPYCPYECTPHRAIQVAQQRVNAAIQAAVEIKERGHFFFIPHLSHYVHTSAYISDDWDGWWYAEDNTFLRHWATALLFLDHSPGADNELELAIKLGLKIYLSVDEIPYTLDDPFLSPLDKTEED